MSRSSKALAELLIEKVNREEAKRIENKRLNEEREEKRRQRRAMLVNDARRECDRVYNLYKTADERGLLGTLSIEKAEKIFINLYRSCGGNPDYVLREVKNYELTLAKNTEEVKTEKRAEQIMWENKARAVLMGGMEYIKYYDQYKEIEKMNIDLMLKDPNANTDAITEHFTKQFPFPYNKCKFTEEEKRMFLSDPTQAKMAMEQMKAWSII